MKITKNERNIENKQEISIENYLTKENIKKENIEEIDIKICNKQRITLIIFFLTWYKNGRKSFHVW